MKPAIAICALLLPIAIARAEVPRFTPNVVDPHHYLDDGSTAEVNGFIDEMRTQAGIEAAVFLTDHLGDDTIEGLANEAFNTWHLGDRAKNDGLLLVLAMADHRMRFEVGYGLEPDLTDLVCKHALDDFVRPQLRAGHPKQAILDGLDALATKKLPSFHVQGHAHATRKATSIDGRWGTWGWIVWAVLVVGVVVTRKNITLGAIGIGVFLLVNPGVFILVGIGALGAHQPEVRAWLATRGSLAQLWFYVLVALAVALPIRWYVARARERRVALRGENADVRALDDEYLKLTKSTLVSTGRSIGRQVAAGFVAALLTFIASLVLDLDVRGPVAYVGLPLVIFAASAAIAVRRLRRFETAESFSAYLRAAIETAKARYDRLVAMGHATRHDDGTYTYTAAYYASQRSSSSGGGSSSSGGGSSGGGGASSSW